MRSVSIDFPFSDFLSPLTAIILFALFSGKVNNQNL
jgi:hypothetical protein